MQSLLLSPCLDLQKTINEERKTRENSGKDIQRQPLSFPPKQTPLKKKSLEKQRKTKKNKETKDQQTQSPLV